MPGTARTALSKCRLVLIALAALGVAGTGAASAYALGVGGPAGGAPGAISSADPDFAGGERRDEARSRRLNSAAGRVERMRSRTAHRGLSRDEALALARSAFPDQLMGPLFDGSHPAAGLRVIDQRGEGSALVEDTRTGKRALLMSTLPLQAKRSDGRLAPIDLSLESTAGGVGPTNSLAPFRVEPVSAAGVSFPGKGVSISVWHGDRHSVQTANDRAFFANVLPDTDVAVAPLPDGAELSVLVRSPDAPEHFALDVKLPEGARLRHAVAKDPIPGDPPLSLEIVRGDRTFGYVHPPVAIDADGQQVPATMGLDGQDIVLDVPHRGRDIRYPVNVDPEMRLYSDYYADWLRWTWTQNRGGGGSFGAAKNDCAYYCGLYQSVPTNTTLTNGSYAQWYYRAPANTYLYRTTFGGIAHNPLNAYGYNHTRSYMGLLNGSATAWESNVNYVNQAGVSGPNPYGPNSGAYYGLQHDFCFNPRCDPTTTSATEQNSAVFGFQAQNAFGGTLLSSGPYKGTNTMAWANVYLGDRRPPSLTTATPASRDWTDEPAGTPHTITPGAHDDGLGIYGIGLNGDYATGGGFIRHGCEGHIDRSPCPANWSQSFTYTLNEGVNNLNIAAQDFVDNRNPGGSWTEKIDRSKPTLSTPSGSLWDARENSADHRYEGVSSNQATLTVAASDAFSGIKEVQVMIDDQPAADPASRITTGGLNWTWNLNSYPIADGRHKIQIVAHDNLWAADSSSAANHIGQTAPFYVTIDRSGDVVHAKEWDGDPGTGGTSETEEWAQLSTQTSRSQMPDMIQTRQRQPCGEDTNEQCDEYRSATRRRDTDGPSAPESYERTTGHAGDLNVPVVGSLLAGDASNPSATGATSAISPPWQHLPVGRGTTYVRFDIPDEYNDQPATYRRYIDSQTHLPLRTEVIDSANVTQLITYWDYDLDRASVSSYQPNFFKLDKPPNVSDSTESDLRRNEAMGPQQDAQTGTMFEPQFLGSVLDRAGLGVLCLASSDYIRFSGSSPQDEVNEDPDPSVPPAQAGASAPETIVTAQYLLTPTLGACTPGTSAFDAPDVDIVSLASASAVAGAWRSAFADEGQSLSQFNGQPVHAVTREDGKLSALVDLGQTTVILTAPVAVNDVLPLLQLLQPR